jgi:hypothetical protein
MNTASVTERDDDAFSLSESSSQSSSLHSSRRTASERCFDDVGVVVVVVVSAQVDDRIRAGDVIIDDDDANRWSIDDRRVTAQFAACCRDRTSVGTTAFETETFAGVEFA